MIGAMSSSLALAQHAATKARATMDTMTRQIATGQKVSSVKDDGAAWTRANGLRASGVQANALRDHVSQMESWAAVRRVGFEESQSLWHDIRAGLLSMTQPNLSASAFSALRQDVQSLMAREVAANFPTYTDGLDGLTGAALTQGALDRSYLRLFNDQGSDLATGNIVAPNGTIIAPGLRAYAGSLIDYSATGGAVRTNSGGTINLVAFDGQLVPRLDSMSDVQSTIGFMALAMEESKIAASQIGQTERVLEQLDQRFARQADRAEKSAASLTDADMGKASSQLRQAESRQQLALSTIQQAISAYGNYAGGLLGNVQQTQRGLIA
jgi:flagellin-like hook-associated protein FlgL